ncbi:hypothetical protein MNBD_GAMMA10-3073, partial [hydrothermal vent metagenome]
GKANNIDFSLVIWPGVGIVYGGIVVN